MTKDDQDRINMIAKLRADVARERQYRDDWQQMTKDLLRIIAGQTDDIQQMSEEITELRRQIAACEGRAPWLNDA